MSTFDKKPEPLWCLECVRNQIYRVEIILHAVLIAGVPFYAECKGVTWILYDMIDKCAA